MSGLPETALKFITGDTIAAIATPSGRGGIGIVRASGPQVESLARAVLGLVPPVRQARFFRFLDAQNHTIDQGLALLFKAPASFTGEDILELHAHGSPVVLDLLMSRLLDLGARHAQAGEFSLRAFLNGKYDLTQLEAIAALIDCASEQAARSAQRALQGDFSAMVHGIHSAITALRVLIEAGLDFSAEEDVSTIGAEEVRHRVIAIRQDLKRLHARARQGALLSGGLQLVIVGQPNVGKSSLLNRLAGNEEAIVSGVAGTTRDVLKSEVLIHGMPVRILDTAGLRKETGSSIEDEGIRRAYRAMHQADLVLLLADAVLGASAFEKKLMGELTARKVRFLPCLNKIDLLSGQKTAANQWLGISAKTGAGLKELNAAIRSHGVVDTAHDANEDAITARRRHLDALQACDQFLLRALDCCRPTTAGGGDELMAEELHGAQQSLAVITGEYSNEDLLGDVFSQFCIGK